jgi:hypothetical protein
MSDDEVIAAYTASLTPEEAAAFLAGLGWGLGCGRSWIAETVRRLLPRRSAALAVGAVRLYPKERR